MKETAVLVTQEAWNAIKETIPLGKQYSQHEIWPNMFGVQVRFATDADIETYPTLKEYGVCPVSIEAIPCNEVLTLGYNIKLGKWKTDDAMMSKEDESDGEEAEKCTNVNT